jgi:hypothetical protein
MKPFYEELDEDSIWNACATEKPTYDGPPGSIGAWDPITEISFVFDETPELLMVGYKGASPRYVPPT